MKSMDLRVRPIRHRSQDHVRAHIFLCMLAYYVEWHMREAWRPLLFADEDLEAKAKRDPAQTFWIIKHGIKMSGMPAWEYRLEERELWAIVAFLDALPLMTPDQ